MCGRFALTASPAAVAELFGLGPIEAFPPRYNIAPTQPILVVLGGRGERPDADRAGREARLVRWGFLPAWLKDSRGVPLLFNARAETAAERNTFRAALRYRRCLVPASGFYEWRKDGTGMPAQAFFLRPRGERPVAFAGLAETWHAADGGEIDTAAIVTVAARGDLRPIHARMPLVIPEGAFERWLNCRDHRPADVADLLAGDGDDGTRFEPVPVSAKVGSVKNTHPDIQDRVPFDGPARPGHGAAPEQLRLL